MSQTPPPVASPPPPKPWAEHSSWRAAAAGFGVAVGSILLDLVLTSVGSLLLPDGGSGSGVGVAFAIMGLFSMLLPIGIAVLLVVRASTRWIGIWALIFLFAMPIVAAGVCTAVFVGGLAGPIGG
jgi:hypothetical protein